MTELSVLRSQGRENKPGKQSKDCLGQRRALPFPCKLSFLPPRCGLRKWGDPHFACSDDIAEKAPRLELQRLAGVRDGAQPV